jgi:hypothetical protein
MNCDRLTLMFKCVITMATHLHKSLPKYFMIMATLLHKSLPKYFMIMATHLLKPLVEYCIIVATHRNNYLCKCTISLPTHLPELPEFPLLRVPQSPAPVTIPILWHKSATSNINMAAIKHTPVCDTAELQSGEYSILAALPLSFSCKNFLQDTNAMSLQAG